MGQLKYESSIKNNVYQGKPIEYYYENKLNKLETYISSEDLESLPIASELFQTLHKLTQ